LLADEATLAAHGLPPRAARRPEHAPIWEFIRSSVHFIEPTFQLIEGSSGAPVDSEVDEGTRTSNNWSGAVIYAPAGTAFKTVTAVWNIPQVFSSANDGGSYYASYWIGMDGSGSRDVFQAGVRSESSGLSGALRDGWQDLTANLAKKCIIVPGRIGHDVMQRLVHLAHVAGGQTRCHRLHALALDRQQEAFGVVLNRDHAIGMPCGFCQAIQIDLEAFPLSREIQSAKAHSINVIPNNLPSQKNQTKGTHFITQ